MATPYSSLTPAQKRMAMAKFHARQDAKTPLTPEQIKKAALAQIVAPGLTRGQLNKTVAADIGLRYGSTEKDLRAQPARINSAFAAYKQAIANASNNLTGSGDQVGGSYGGAVQQVKDLQSGLDTTAKDQWAGQQQAMAADAASRGATADPRLADVAHNASNVRDILTGSYGAMLLGQGANARQGFVDRGVNAEQQRGEQQSGVRANLQKLLADKGTFKVSDAAQRISDANSNYLKQYLAGTTAANTKSEIAARRSQTKISQQNADTSATSAKQSQTQWAQSSNKYGVTNGEWANWSDTKRQSWIKSLPSKSKSKGNGNSPKPVSGPGSLTPALEQKRLSTVRKIAQYYRAGVTQQVKQPDGSYKAKIIAAPGDLAAVRTWLVQQGVDPLAITIGQSLYSNKGKLGITGVHAAHRYGIHIGGNFGIAPTGGAAIPGLGAVTG